MNAPIPLRPSYADAERLERLAWNRAIAAVALALKRKEDPARVLRSAWPNDARAMSVLTAAVSQTTTADFPKADAVAAFRSIAPASAAAKLFDVSNKVDLSGVSTIKVPMVAGLPPQPVFVAEGAPAPALAFSTAATTLGPVRKILVLSAVTAELENAGPESASTVIGTVLADACNAAVDMVAFDDAPGDAVRPPGLLHNTVPLPPTAAGSDAMAEDLAALIAEIASFGIDPTNVIFVASPREAALITFRAGPNFSHRVLMSMGVPAKSVLAFAPAGVFCAYDGTPSIEVMKEALIHFEDTAPANISDSGVVAAPTKSAFQTDLLALKIRAECSWVAVPGAAQSIAGVTW